MQNYNQNINIKLLFTNYLNNLSISQKSKINYMADANHFFNWLENAHPNISTDTLANSLHKHITKSYIKEMVGSNTPQKTINRRLTTLRHFAKFLSSFGYTKEAGAIKNVKKNNFNPKPVLIAGLLTLALLIVASLYLKNDSQLDKLTNPEFANLSPSSNSKIYIIDARNQNTDDLSSTKTALYSLEKAPVSITLDGQLPTNKEASSKQLNFQPQSQDYGKGVIPAGSTETTIHTQSVSTASVVLITPLNSHADYYISNVSNGYFTVKIDKKANQTLAFSWLVR